MTVKKLSKNTLKKKPKKDEEILAEKFIGGGGKTSAESDRELDREEEMSKFTIRIPRETVEMIDEHRKKRVGNVSRNTWILEAISLALKKV